MTKVVTVLSEQDITSKVASIMSEIRDFARLSFISESGAFFKVYEVPANNQSKTGLIVSMATNSPDLNDLLQEVNNVMRYVDEWEELQKQISSLNCQQRALYGYL